MGRRVSLYHRLAWRIRPPVLALGGGGARGFAHLGVLQVLDEQRLPVRAIAGTSMGAVIGAMYFARGSAASAIDAWRRAIDEDLVPPVRTMSRIPEAHHHEHPLIQIARKLRNQIVVSFAINRSTMLDDKDLMRAFEVLVPEIVVEELPRPFVAVATDLESGDEVRIREGPLRRALKASSAIPGVLPAVRFDGRLLVDGGVVAEIPVAAAQALGWPIVAVDVSMEPPPLREHDIVLDTMIRTQMFTARLLRRRELSRVRAVIRPHVGHTTWADWDRFDELVVEGRRAALEFFGLTEEANSSEGPADES
jgi:NTE family protein